MTAAKTTTVEEALAKIDAARAAVGRAEQEYAVVAERDELAVRATLGGELETAHQAVLEAVEPALEHVTRALEAVDRLNALDDGRRTIRPEDLQHRDGRPPRGRKVPIPVPQGFVELAEAIRAALVPLPPLPATSPTLLDREVMELAMQIDRSGGEAVWQRPEWAGINTRVKAPARTPAESEALLRDLRRMQESRRAPNREERAAAAEIVDPGAPAL